MNPELAIALGSVLSGFIGGLWLLLRDNRDHLRRTVVEPINMSNSALARQLQDMVASMKTASDTAIKAYAEALYAKSEQLTDVTARCQALEQAFNEYRRHADVNHEELRRQIALLEEKIRGKETELATARQTIDALKQQIDALSAQMKAIGLSAR
jgi:chromosome segregation ATPase